MFPVVSSVALAKRLSGLGADGIVAEGCESGGHIGELTTMALVPQICDAVNVPVIAAGGIAAAGRWRRLLSSAPAASRLEPAFWPATSVRSIKTIKKR